MFALENQHLNPTNNPFLTGRLSVTQNEWLREPQRDAHQVVGEHFASCSEPVVLQIPVGCGKTGLMGILPFGIARGRVLIVAPNLTIREAIFDSIDSASRNCFWRQFDVATASPCGPFAAKIDGPDTTLSDCEQSHFIVTNIQQLSASKGKWLNAFPSDFFDMGELPARTVYEISKLEDETQQRTMLSDVSSEGLTNQQARNRVRVKKGKGSFTRAGTKLTFTGDADHRIVVSSPTATTYEAIEAALQTALEEVRHRIENNIQIM